MDDFNQNINPNNTNDTENTGSANNTGGTGGEPRTPFQTPIRGEASGRGAGDNTNTGGAGAHFSASYGSGDTNSANSSGSYNAGSSYGAGGTNSANSAGSYNAGSSYGAGGANSSGSYNAGSSYSSGSSGSSFGADSTSSAGGYNAGSSYGSGDANSSGGYNAGSSYGAGGTNSANSYSTGSTPGGDQTYNGAYAQWSGLPKKPKKRAKKPKKPGRWKWVVGIVAVAAVAFGGGMIVSNVVDLSGSGTSATDSTASSSTSGTQEIPADSTTVEISSTTEDMASYSDVYDKVSPSIVSVVVDSIQDGTSGTGSGVIMSEDGYIITNNHVVEDADKYTVVLSDSTTYEAELIGTDDQTDLAVLKIDATGLTAAEFGDSDSVKVGDRAFAIGSPGGVEYQNSFTGGFISAINRNVTINDRVMTLIQTDTAINPGNSGGALINSSGQVIGITSSKLSGSTSSGASIEGMGFAIPTSTVKEIVDQLIAYGYVTGRPAIGISGYDIDETRAAYYNVPQGVLVSGVDSASDAATQGVKSGDIITGVNGTEITCMNDINTIKEELSAGDKMTLTIYRSGKTMDIEITLIDEADLAGDSSSSSSSTDESTNGSDDSSSDDSSGGYSYSFPYGYGYTIP